MGRTIWLLSLCQAVLMSSGSLVIASSALVGLALAEDKSLATLPLALQFLATMLTTLPASLLMRRIGRRPGFLLGVMAGAAGALLATWSISQGWFAGFCAAMLLFGIFNGFGVHYRFAALESVADERKNSAIAYVLAGGLLAAFIGPALAAHSRDWLPGADFAGSYAMLLVLYAIAFLALLAARLPHAGGEEGLGRGRPWGEIAAQPVFIVAVLCGALGYATMTLVMTATPLAMKVCGLAFDDTAFVIQWHVFAMFAPSFFTGRLIDRFGVLRVMFVGGLFNLACVVVNLYGESLWHYWSALFMLGIGWNFLFVGATSLLTESYRPEERARVQGLNDFLVFSCVSIATLSAGALQYNFGWRMVNWGVLPVIGLTLAALLWLGWRRAPSRGLHDCGG